MKRFTLSLLALCGIMSLTFAQGFEGTITAVSSLRASVKTEFIIKGDKTRQQPIGPGLADMMVYTDLADNAYFLWVKYQNGIQVTRYFLTGSSRQVPAPAVTFSNVAASGNQKTISGYVCDEYTGMVDGRTFTAWVAKDLKEVDLKPHITSQSIEHLTYAYLPDVEGLVLDFSSTFSASNQAFTISIDVNPHVVDPAVVTAPEPTHYAD